jgi:long-chain acyl-CoA synthetase
MKIYELLTHNAENNGNKTALEHDNVCVTYKELRDNITQISSELKKKNIGKGVPVAIIMDNSVEFVHAILAVNMCQGVSVPIYANTGKYKLINMINHYEIRFVITLEKFRDLFDIDMLNECPGIKGIFYMTYNELVYLENDNCDRGLDFYEQKDLHDVALILFSSGTTSIPKGIMLTDRNIISNVSSISKYLQLKARDKILLIKNINHSSSITGELLVGLYNGCTVCMTSKIPSPALIFEYIQNKSVSILFAVPSILIGILNSRHKDLYRLDNVRIINFYGASIPYSKVQDLAEKFPWVNLIYSYGLTEASPRVTYIYKEDFLKKNKSSGKAIDGVEVFIVDEDGKELEPGCIGEIVVKGPNVMKGYFKNRPLTEIVLRNGLLFTGDMGYFDEDKYLYVTGRKDNMIIISGKNVYPEEIESVIYGFCGVKEVLVRGEPDEVYGVRIVAYVVPDSNVNLNTNNILLHCRNYLENYKIPEKIVQVAGLEKTISGKYIRNQTLNS